VNVPHALLTIRRHVPGSGLSAYLAAWERLRAAAAAAGAHAWLFRSPAQPGLYLEFLEWAAAAAPLVRADVAAALATLAAAFPGEDELWDEVPAAGPPPPGR
jgi:hypothetical protein